MNEVSRKRREFLIENLCENLLNHADMDTVCNFFLESQIAYMDKEASSSELLELLVEGEIITQKEADNIKQNGY